MPDATPEQITAFIERWEHSGAAERANYASFLSELCTLLDLPRPDPSSPDNSRNTYVFERAITRRNPDGTTSPGFIDLYRRGSFVWECKQGTKRQQEQHPGLTLTGMYNVLEILRSGEPLTPKDKAVHDKGLVSVLRQIHDELDAAVLEAYGWQDLSA